MNALNSAFIFVAAFLAVYVQTAFDSFRNIAGAQFDLLPPLMVYASLTHGVGLIAGLAICSGLWFDSLSANPLGISILPLFFVGIVIYRYRTLLLRDRPYAQFVLGVIASAVAPLGTLVLLFTMNTNPLFGWASLWQWIVVTICGGVATPLLFQLFDWINRTLNYREVKESSFRPDREIKRGRH